MKPWPLLLLAACTVGDDPERFVIEGDDVIVQADALIVPSAGHRDLGYATAGDLVAGIQSGGYLRRIVAVSHVADRYEFATVDIPLSEAVPDAESQLNDGKGDGSQHQVSLGFAVDNKVLHRDPYVTIELAHASLAFRPTIDLDLSISGARLEHFLAVARGRIDGELAIAVTAPAGGQWHYAKQMWSDKSTFVQWVGWVPVVEVVEMKTGVGVDLQAEGAIDLVATGSLSASLRGGVEYDGAWRGIGDAQMAREGSLTDGAQAPVTLSVKPYVYAELHVWMYGVAGPYVKARTGLRFRHTPQTGQSDRAVTLAVDGGAILDLPFGDDLRYDARVIDRAWSL